MGHLGYFHVFSDIDDAALINAATGWSSRHVGDILGDVPVSWEETLNVAEIWVAFQVEKLQPRADEMCPHLSPRESRVLGE